MKVLDRVIVKELNEAGHIYEKTRAESGKFWYGVRFDKTVFPNNFVATTVWHCYEEDLEYTGVQE